MRICFIGSVCPIYAIQNPSTTLPGRLCRIVLRLVCRGLKCNTCKVGGGDMYYRRTKTPILISFFFLNGRSVFNSRFSEIIQRIFVASSHS
ncbi:hypothetical protein L6452_03824 [Arctium lappa]|uniref:Uncharacterized protein n=1 Tax=Arctium lappa TaxID=4217 RepID=A0ACB9FMZ3_ARCLA|nr:hypothetical protein L6452_03824 [Arctium lappa]